MTTDQDSGNRPLITVAILMATLMNSLDTTIANVALPHMQGAVSASAEQISWVLTSYIVAGAIMTPLGGWLADRVGRKRVFLVSIAGFTVASMLCGTATNLAEIVLYRLLQGAFGAAMVPLGQAVLLDINPREKHAQAMSVWGMGAVLGPILGPALGGYLTENLSWRWCFYINLPIGIISFLLLLVFLSKDRPEPAKRFDFLGFGMLSLFIASFQLMLDRGPVLDWFHSPEIWTYAILALIGLWVFIVQSLSTSEPFFDAGLMSDRNFITGSIFGFFIGVLLFSVMALLPQLMQGILGYPVLTSGLVSVPRGFGSLASMFLFGRISGRVDPRILILGGLLTICVSLWQMTHFDLAMTAWPLMTSGALQGFGMGMTFVPMTLLAFATLPGRLRAQGSALFTLIRGLGASVGISVMNALLVSNTQVMHASLAAKVVPSDPVVRAALPGMFDPATLAGATALNSEITRQATMVAYVDDFRLMLVIVTLCIPMLLLLRKPKGGAGAEASHAAIE